MSKARGKPKAETIDRSIHLVRDVVDHEVVDAHQLPCGSVDDIELELDSRHGLRPVALLIGPGAWQRRLPTPLAALARWLAGTTEIRVPSRRRKPQMSMARPWPCSLMRLELPVMRLQVKPPA